MKAEVEGRARGTPAAPVDRRRVVACGGPHSCAQPGSAALPDGLSTEDSALTTHCGSSFGLGRIHAHDPSLPFPLRRPTASHGA